MVPIVVLISINSRPECDRPLVQIKTGFLGCRWRVLPVINSSLHGYLIVSDAPRTAYRWTSVFNTGQRTRPVAGHVPVGLDVPAVRPGRLTRHLRCLWSARCLVRHMGSRTAATSSAVKSEMRRSPKTGST